MRTAVVLTLSLAAGVAAVWGLSRRNGDAFTGHIAARTTFVTADRAGVVVAYLAGEGDRVTIGDALLTLADGDLQFQTERKREQVAALQTQLIQSEAEAEIELAWRLKEIDADIVETQLRSADYLKEKFDYELERSMWSDTLSEYETVLFDQGDTAFKSLVMGARLPNEQRMHAVLRLETASNAIDVSSVQVEICDGQLKRLGDLKERLPERVHQKAGVDVAKERLEQTKAELARLEARQAELTVVSQAVGTVGVFRRKPGDHLQAGDPIVELLDDAQRWLIVDVPSSQITEFTVGRGLELTFPGDQEREGEVCSIAPQAKFDEGQPTVDAMVTVRVEQSGKLWPEVPIGSNVEVRLAE